jgi:tetratricopeptide (TPR) repeat protein
MNRAQEAFNNKDYHKHLQLWEIALENGENVKKTKQNCLNAAFKWARLVLIPRKDYSEAIIYLDKAISYNENDSRVLNILTQTKIGCLYEMGKREIDYPKSISLFQKALELNPSTFLETKIRKHINLVNEKLEKMNQLIDEIDG